MNRVFRRENIILFSSILIFLSLIDYYYVDESYLVANFLSTILILWIVEKVTKKFENKYNNKKS